MIYDWQGDNGATDLHINDRWDQIFDAASIPEGNMNDRLYAWLGNLGYTQINITERWKAFWEAGGTLLQTLLSLWDNTEAPIADANTGQSVSYPTMTTTHWVNCANGSDGNFILREVPAGAIVREGYDFERNHLTQFAGVSSENLETFAINNNASGNATLSGNTFHTENAQDRIIKTLSALTTAARVWVIADVEITTGTQFDFRFGGAGLTTHTLNHSGLKRVAYYKDYAAGDSPQLWFAGTDSTPTTVTINRVHFAVTPTTQTIPPRYVPVGVGVQQEVLTNYDFTNGATGWTADPAWDFSGGSASLTSSTSQYSSIRQSASLKTGKKYLIQADATTHAGGNITLVVRNSTDTATLAFQHFSPGNTIKLYFVATAEDVVIKCEQRNTTSTTVVLDSLSVRGTWQDSTGADGCAYFNTYNGNTVDANGVVTEADGTAIDTDQLGVLLEAPAGNKLQSVEVLNPASNTNWILSGAGLAATLSIADDSANLFTDYPELAGISNGEVYVFDNTAGTSAAFANADQAGNTNTHTLTVYIRSTTAGAGLLNFWDWDGGQQSTSSINYEQLTVSKAPASSTSRFSVRVDAGEVVYFIAPKMEESPVPTSFTESSSPSATNDVSVLLADIPWDDDEGSLELDVIFKHDWADLPSETKGILVVNNQDTSCIYRHANRLLTSYDSTTAVQHPNTLTLTKGTQYKIKVYWVTGGNFNISANGVKATAQSYDGSWNTSTLLELFRGFGYGALVQGLKVYDTAQEQDDWLEAA